MSVSEKVDRIRSAIRKNYPDLAFAMLRWTMGRPDRDVQLRFRQPRGTYNRLIVVWMDELRAPTDGENRYFAHLQEAYRACVVVCYCEERALEAIDSYLSLAPGQRFGEGIPVFKGGPG